MNREIWFERWGWSYLPCHWKGFAVMAVVGFPTIAASSAAALILDHLGYKDLVPLAFSILIGAAIFTLRAFAKRTS